MLSRKSSEIILEAALIIRLTAKQLRWASDFVQSAITSDPQSQWLVIRSTSISVSFQIGGLVDYEAVIGASEGVAILKPGEVVVSSKVFCDLIAKVKNPGSEKFNVAQFETNSAHLTISGPGFEYLLPVMEGRIQSIVPTGELLWRSSALASGLLGVVVDLKAIKEAESDSDVPSVEMGINFPDGVQFVSATRYRSVGVWLKDSLPDLVRSAVGIHLAVEQIQKMEKALKLAAKSLSGRVTIEAYLGSALFFVAGGRIRIRCLEKPASKIHDLIKYSTAPQNVRCKLLVDGRSLKESYDRLDAFGKRNSASIHRIDFTLEAECLHMRAWGSGVGSGKEAIVLSPRVELPEGKKELHFSASGSKLADLLRVSGYKQIEVLVGKKNLVLKWEDEHAIHLAILAGLANDKGDYS